MNYKDKILSYLKSGRRGKSANRLERDAMRDPFLNDALDGFANTNNEEKLLSEIDHLQKLIEKRTRKTTRKNYRWIAASAAVILAVITGFWFVQNENKEQYAVLETKSHYEQSNQIPDKQTNIENIEKKENLILEADETVNQDINQQNTRDNIDIRVAEKNQPYADNIKMRRETARHQVLSEIEMAEELDLKMMDGMPQILKVEEEEAKISTDSFTKNSDSLTGYLAEQSTAALLRQTTVQSLPKARVDKLDEFVRKNDNDELSEVVIVGFGKSKKNTQKKESTIYVGANDSLNTYTKLSPVIGVQNYQDYLKNNLVYPKDALEQKIEGNVELSFKINRKGKPQDIKVEKSLSPTCDKEAVRLLKKGSKWIPGGATDERVKIIIEFKLSN